MRDEEAQKPQTAPSSSSCTNLATSFGGKRDSPNLEGLFGRGKYKLWALTAITLLALWSMFTGSVTLKSSAVNLDRLSEDLEPYSHGDLDVLDVDEREKMVRQMWNVYQHSNIARLPSFWRDAFGAAYEELTSEISSIRNGAILEIAKMSFWSHDIYDSPPTESTSRLSKEVLRPSINSRKMRKQMADGSERTGEENLGAARFRSQQQRQEGFDYQISPNRATLDDDFRQPAAGGGSSRSLDDNFRRASTREDSAWRWPQVGRRAAANGGDFLGREPRWAAEDFSTTGEHNWGQRQEGFDYQISPNRAALGDDFRQPAAGGGSSRSLDDNFRRASTREDSAWRWPQVGRRAAANGGDFLGREPRWAAEDFSTTGEHNWGQHAIGFGHSRGSEARRGQPWADTIFGGSGSLDRRRAGVCFAGDGGRYGRRDCENAAGYGVAHCFGFHREGARVQRRDLWDGDLGDEQKIEPAFHPFGPAQENSSTHESSSGRGTKMQIDVADSDLHAR
ncbi:Protein of unknown function (DUF1195 [Striga hermonthica]|uniref:Uncharacterized protein n=1 Tax=Striga hermonthica TaxID=68872 RepID=A0A9N7P088_STRHE|nr:Protein of unknown function (DUF1195 [Striga hermonthica]